MTCERTDARLDALADGELPAPEAREVSAHVAACPACAARLGEIRALSAAVRERAPRYRAPDSLRAAVAASIRTAAALADDPDAADGAPGDSRLDAPPAAAVRADPADDAGARVTPIASRRRWHARRWLAAAAAVLLLAGTGRGAWVAGRDSARAEAEADQVLAGHVRALMGTHLADVASTDQHTVKPWFDGRVDFAPPVYDLADQGYPLTGGRLDYVEGHRAAALVYGRRKHVIDLFVWPAESAEPTQPRWQTRRGYHMARWDAAGMRHWAVSDLNEAELRAFVNLLRDREPNR